MTGHHNIKHTVTHHNGDNKQIIRYNPTDKKYLNARVLVIAVIFAKTPPTPKDAIVFAPLIVRSNHLKYSA